MPRSRRRFTREFKLDAVQQTLSGDRSIRQIADDLGISVEALYRWRTEYRSDPEQVFPGNGTQKERDQEVDGLKREVEKLRAENSFLKKVSAYFAKGPK